MFFTKTNKELGWYSFGVNIIFSLITVILYYSEFGKMQLLGLFLMSIAMYQFLDYIMPIIEKYIDNIFILILIILTLLAILTQLTLYILR